MARPTCIFELNLFCQEQTLCNLHYASLVRVDVGRGVVPLFAVVGRGALDGLVLSLQALATVEHHGPMVKSP